MLTDYLGQKEEAKEFNTFSAAQPLAAPESNFDFQIQCLKTANWPNYLAINMQMPGYISEKFQ